MDIHAGSASDSLSPEHLTSGIGAAFEVLEHMTYSVVSTRSEVCALHHALVLGYSGFVLSDETAIGRDPRDACQTAAMFQDHGRIRENT